MALTGMAVMAALALAKNQMIDQPAADRKRKYEANTAALSPWTGMKSQYVEDPNAIGAVIGGAGAGAALGSQISGSNLTDSLASNPAISGTDNVLGGTDMSKQLGSRATDFSKSVPSSWSGVAANEKAGVDPAWFYGNSPSKFSQPSLGSPVDPNAQPSWMKLQSKKLTDKDDDDNSVNQIKANY